MSKDESFSKVTQRKRDGNNSIIVLDEGADMDLFDTPYNKKMVTMSFIPSIEKSIEGVSTLTTSKQNSITSSVKKVVKKQPSAKLDEGDTKPTRLKKE